MDLFLACCDMSREERTTFLLESCGADSELLGEVERMFAFEEQRPKFLAGKAADLLRPLESELPRSIGSFRILRKLGEGGMGAVYEAEQERPRRTVALKVLRPFFLSPDALRRFEHESEFLARLQHPGIAQVFDSGCAETEHGPVPYFAMELVRGEPLTDYANGRGLSARERLELIALVADAVQHAHQHGVIHRDLKPQNILVDGSGQPKVLDFGIARASDSDVQLTTFRTDVGQILGTLAYMSPEQAAGDPRAIDTRSDVYSLGVLLYELLADGLPYDVARKGLPEAVRVIQDEEPRPLATVNRTYRGDVDTIVRTALEKEPDRRYASAAALATDIRRFLRNEPITARPPSRIYTLRKFARRNRTVVVATSAVFVALAIGLVMSLRFALGEAEQRRIAERGTYGDKLSLAQSAMRAGDGRAARELLAAAPERLRNWEWRYLDQRLDPALARTSLPGVVAAVFLDEITILAVDDACTVHAWNALTGERAPDPRRFAGERPLALTADGRLMLSYAEGALILRNPLGGRTAGKPSTILPFPGSEPRAEWGTAAVASDGSRVVVATESGEVRLIDVEGETRTVPAEELLGGVRSLAIGLDGSWFAAGLVRGIRSWDAKSMQPSRYASKPTHGMGPAAFAPDGTALAMTWSYAPADIWINRMDGEGSLGVKVHELGSHRFRVCSRLCYSASRDLLAETFADGETWIVAVTDEGGTLVSSVKDESGVRVTFSPSGESLLSLGPGTGSLELRSTGLESATEVLRDHTSYVYAVAFSPDGATLASASFDGNIRLSDGVSGEPIVAWHIGGKVHSLVFSPDGEQLASARANGGDEGSIRIWDTATGNVLRRPGIHEIGGAACYSLAYSPDGSLFAAGVADGRIVIWHTQEFEEPLVTGYEPDGKKGIHALAFHPDGRLLAAGALNGEVSLWDPRSGDRIVGEQRDALGVSRGAGVNSLSFSPDGTRLAAGFGNSAVTIFEVRSLREVRVLQGHSAEVFAVAYSPDGARLASGGRDGSLVLWDASTGELLIKLDGHSDYIKSLAFSPDGCRIATGSGDKTVRIWDSEPAVKRWQAKHTDDRLRPEAEHFVERLFEELGEASEVAQRIRADADLSPDLRRLALQSLLSRAK